MQIFYLLIFMIINSYCIYFLYKNNKDMRKEIKEIREWCADIVNNLIEQEVKIDEILSDIIKDINNKENNSNTDYIQEVLKEKNNIIEKAKRSIDILEQ